MKILFIAPGFPPYMFSENIVNGKLVLAFKEEGWNIDVISRTYEGVNYSQEWQEPFSELKENTFEIKYSHGNIINRVIDLIHSIFLMDGYFIPGIRWAKRAYLKSIELVNEKKYDLIISRSPTDIGHLVARKLSKKTKTPWIANWNDPADTIWPEPYKQQFSILNKFILNRFIKKALYTANVNTFPSETLKNHFSKHFSFLVNKRSEIIPHISLVGYKSKNVSFKDTSNNSLRLCHAGNLSVERNPELLFKVFKKIKEMKSIDISLDIMGVVNDYTENLIKKYNLQKEVRFIGGYPFMEALDKMAEYDVLVLIEAKMKFGIFFPSKLVDYNQVNAPILAISPAQGYSNNLFSKFKAGISINNEDENDIYNAINKLVELKKTNKLIDAFDLASLQKFYSTQEITNQYKRIFKEIL